MDIEDVNLEQLVDDIKNCALVHNGNLNSFMLYCIIHRHLYGLVDNITVICLDSKISVLSEVLCELGVIDRALYKDSPAGEMIKVK